MQLKIDDVLKILQSIEAVLLMLKNGGVDQIDFGFVQKLFQRP